MKGQVMLSAIYKIRSVKGAATFYPIAALTLFLTSCASTEIYENGQKVFHTQADMTNVDFSTANGTRFHADTINHSNPMAVQGQAAAGIVTAATAAAIGFGTVIK